MGSPRLLRSSSTKKIELKDEFRELKHLLTLMMGPRKTLRDGSLRISALKCLRNVYKGSIANGSNVEVGPIVALMRETPNMKLIKSNRRVLHLLLQIRFFPNGYAVKGTVLVNKKLPSRSIEVRDPMIKVRSDSNP
ncbi:hypothetical protein V6N13_039313 [Hibiscus sabdariffa]